MSLLLPALILVSAVFWPDPAQAELSLLIGPPSVGTGGPNPVGIPPSIIDYQVGWTSGKDTEWTLSIFPGFFYGKRFKGDFGTFGSLGGGLVTKAGAGGGLGPGIYTAVGWRTCGWVCFVAEYRKAFALVRSGFAQPYAVRIGVAIYPD